MGGIEKKIFNTDFFETTVSTGIVIEKDETLKILREKLRVYLSYENAYLLDDFFNRINEIHKKQSVKFYEKGILDGIRLSYEIKEK